MVGFILGTAAAMLICTSVPCSALEVSTCNVPSVEAGGKMEFTCNFGVNMQEEGRRKDVVLKRTVKGTSDEILDCYWVNAAYNCKVKSSRFVFNNEITESVTVSLSEVTADDEGQYICEVVGREAALCSFTLSQKSDNSNQWKGVAIAFIVLFLLAVSGATAFVVKGYLPLWKEKRELEAGAKGEENAELLRKTCPQSTDQQERYVTAVEVEKPESGGKVQQAGPEREKTEDKNAGGAESVKKEKSIGLQQSTNPQYLSQAGSAGEKAEDKKADGAKSVKKEESMQKERMEKSRSQVGQGDGQDHKEKIPRTGSH